MLTFRICAPGEEEGREGGDRRLVYTNVEVLKHCMRASHMRRFSRMHGSS